MNEWDNADEERFSQLEAIDRLSTIESDVAYIARGFGLIPPNVDDIVAFSQAIAVLMSGAPLAERWPDGTPVKRGLLTARQVLYLADLAGTPAPLVREELAAHYGASVNVSCTFCGARPGEWCRTKTKHTAWQPHANRLGPPR